MTESLFPFTIYSYDNGHFIRNPKEYMDIFLANSPKDMRWFAFHVVIQSPTDVTFVVHGIADVAKGGIGKKIGEFSVKVKIDDTKESIYRQALRIARDRREAELIKEECCIIREYALEILRADRRFEIELAIDSNHGPLATGRIEQYLGYS